MEHSVRFFGQLQLKWWGEKRHIYKPEKHFPSSFVTRMSLTPNNTCEKCSWQNQITPCFTFAVTLCFISKKSNSSSWDKIHWTKGFLDILWMNVHRWQKTTTTKLYVLLCSYVVVQNPHFIHITGHKMNQNHSRTFMFHEINLAQNEIINLQKWIARLIKLQFLLKVLEQQRQFFLLLHKYEEIWVTDQKII